MDIRTIKTYTSHENRKVEDLHQTIKSDVKYSRLIVIGDVHGCVVELEELLLKCGYDSSKDLVVLVGDLVNKGPHSAKVVKLVRKYGFKSVIGNHDDYILLQKQLKRANQPIHPHFLTWIDELDNEDEQLLQSLPFSIYVEQFNTLIVHAGFLPNEEIHKQSLPALYKMRNIIENADGSFTPTEDFLVGKPWASYVSKLSPDNKTTIVFGHDAIRKLQKYDRCFGIDTGCVYGFHLTALILPSEEIVQVQAHQQYTKPKYE